MLVNGFKDLLSIIVKDFKVISLDGFQYLSSPGDLFGLAVLGSVLTVLPTQYGDVSNKAYCPKT